MLTKHSDRVPIICIFDKKTMPSLKNGIKEVQKFLAPRDITFGQFTTVIRRKLSLNSTESVFVLVEDSNGNGKVLCTSSDEIGVIHDARKNKEDSFLYFHITKENTFG